MRGRWQLQMQSWRQDAMMAAAVSDALELSSHSLCVVRLLTPRCSLLSFPQTFSVAPSLGSNITQTNTAGVRFWCLLLSSEKKKKNWQISRIREMRENWELSEQGCLMRDSRANTRLQVDDHWFKRHGSELWQQKAKLDHMIMAMAFLDNVRTTELHYLPHSSI